MTPSDDERLDLTALDPTRDRVRFETLVRSTVTAAMARRRRSATTEALRWWRPALALAASLALAAWLPVLFGTSGDDPTTATRGDPAIALLTLSRPDANPSPTDILTTFGASR
jgi:hypothetical protein